MGDCECGASGMIRNVYIAIIIILAISILIWFSGKEGLVGSAIPGMFPVKLGTPYDPKHPSVVSDRERNNYLTEGFAPVSRVEESQRLANILYS